ncbi:MAG TPA: hypothetical protein VH019_08840 [Rhizomicrobium sp.]|jgi:hypothetical protein|nr:hypothetical protein [Rhizomicrobium sp.]
MKETPQTHSLPYFLASLAGIARALEDFGYRDEANELFRVKRELENKILPSQKE